MNVAAKHEHHVTRSQLVLERKKFRRKSLRHNLDLYLLLLIPLIYIAIFQYVPIYGYLLAFKHFSPTQGILGSQWAGLHYIKQFVNSYQFLRVLWNTVKLSVGLLIIATPFSLMLAVCVVKSRTWFLKKATQFFTYIPYFFSMVIVTSMIMQVLHPRVGLINIALTSLGFESTNLLARPSAFVPIYVASSIWQYAGYGSILFIAVLTGIDYQLYESAEIDGANQWRQLLHIDLPYLMPTLSVVFIVRIGQVLSVGFEKAYLLQNSLNLEASEILPTYIFKLGLQQGLFSLSTAVNLFNTVLNLVIVVLANSLVKRLKGQAIY